MNSNSNKLPNKLPNSNTLQIVLVFSLADSRQNVRLQPQLPVPVPATTAAAATACPRHPAAALPPQQWRHLQAFPERTRPDGGWQLRGDEVQSTAPGTSYWCYLSHDWYVLPSVKCRVTWWRSLNLIPVIIYEIAIMRYMIRPCMVSEVTLQP